jgi:hypothetical protein
MVVYSGTFSKSNSGCGFKAEGEGSDMQLGEYCRAYSNKDHGFSAELGASMRIDRKADAMSNELSGFCVEGAHSRLETGEKCSATANGSHGFLAKGGGHLLVGRENESTGSAGCGFMSSGRRSLVKLSAGCTASSNKRPGFHSAGKGTLVKAIDCRQSENGTSTADDVFFAVSTGFLGMLCGALVSASLACR